jgi:hypothetical protein
MRNTSSNAKKNGVVIFDSTVRKLQKDVKSKIVSFVMFGFSKEKRKHTNKYAYKA